MICNVGQEVQVFVEGVFFPNTKAALWSWELPGVDVDVSVLGVARRSTFE
jgi:hypothetical protein